MSSTGDNQLLKMLAVSIVDNPRSTIKDLAESVGISKATLHRYCGTRENLDLMLHDKVYETLGNLIQVAEMESEDYLSGLKKLTEAHYDNKEYLRYMYIIQVCEEEEFWQSYFKAIDTFFLKGQKAGIFNIEFGVSILSEIYVSAICGLIDAERRGRVASNGIEAIFEKLFLFGALDTSQK